MAHPVFLAACSPRRGGNSDCAAETAREAWARDAAADVGLFFRVTRPFGKVKLTVRSGDAVLVSRSALKAAPGEMEKLIVKRDLLTGLSDPITVEVEELS